MEYTLKISRWTNIHLVLNFDVYVRGYMCIDVYVATTV